MMRGKTAAVWEETTDAPSPSESHLSEGSDHLSASDDDLARYRGVKVGSPGRRSTSSSSTNAFSAEEEALLSEACWPIHEVATVDPEPLFVDGVELPREPSSSSELVDLSHKEGRARGQELLALLRVRPAQSSRKPLMVGAGYSISANLARKAQLSTVATPFVPYASRAEVAATAAMQAETLRWKHAIFEAARSVFGVNWPEVEGNVEDGFTVRTDQAAERWSPAEEVVAFGQHLCVHFGEDVWQCTPTVIPRRAWLSLDYLRQPPPDVWARSCWEFKSCGVCPRGARCRWEHPVPVAYSVDVELQR